MSEYNIGFSEKLIECAQSVASEDLNDIDAVRTVLYLSSLASEIALKALLEKAGLSVKDIRSRGHSLSKLLTDFGKCQIQYEVTAGSRTWVSATRIRSEGIDHNPDITIGHILTGEENGASKYPNELRYGDHVKDYPPELKLGAAKAVVEWAREHWDEIRLSSGNP